MEKARLEFDLVIMTSIEDLLKKTGVKPKEIGVVVVNCSLFTPTPSLSASIMNRFKMGNNVINYNLGGMGCSGEHVRLLEQVVKHRTYKQLVGDIIQFPQLSHLEVSGIV